MLTLCLIAYALFHRQYPFSALSWTILAAGTVLGVGAGCLPWSKGTRFVSYAILLELAILNFATIVASGPAGFSVHSLLGYIAGLVLSAVLLFPASPELSASKRAVWDRRFCSAFAILLLCTPFWLGLALTSSRAYVSHSLVASMPGNLLLLFSEERLWMFVIPAWGLVLVWRCLDRSSGTAVIR